MLINKRITQHIIHISGINLRVYDYWFSEMHSIRMMNHNEENASWNDSLRHNWHVAWRQLPLIVCVCIYIAMQMKRKREKKNKPKPSTNMHTKALWFRVVLPDRHNIWETYGCCCHTICLILLYLLHSAYKNYRSGEIFRISAQLRQFFESDILHTKNQTNIQIAVEALDWPVNEDVWNQKAVFILCLSTINKASK